MELKWLRYVVRINCTTEKKIVLLSVMVFENFRKVQWFTLSSFIYFFDHIASPEECHNCKNHNFSERTFKVFKTKMAVAE